MKYLAAEAKEISELGRDRRVCVRTKTPNHKWQANRNSQPRSGARIQPRAEALGCNWEMTQPQRGVRSVLTQTRLSRPSSDISFASAAKYFIRAGTVGPPAPYREFLITTVHGTEGIFC